MKNVLLCLCVVFVLCGSSCVYATDYSCSTISLALDSVEDSTAVKKPHSPKKAALMSAIFPGLGQIYNRKYWKVPLVYGTFGAAVYFISYNTSQYNYFRNQYTYLVDYQAGNSDGSLVNPEYLNYNADGLKQQSLQFKRLQELSFVVAGAVYILNIVDASVDAHLFTFDVSDDLSFKVNPTVINSFSGYSSLHYTPGVSFKLNFR